MGRVRNRYELEDLDEELRQRRADGASLRALETVVNKRILEQAIERNEADLRTPLPDDRGVDTVYNILAKETTAADTEQVQVQTRLEQAGIDIDTVTDDWVSHVTIKTHLNDCLSIGTDRETSITEGDAIDTVEWARARSENVIAETVRRLESAGLVEIGDPTVTVSVRLTCEVCGRAYSIQDLLADGGCACSDAAPNRR